MYFTQDTACVFFILFIQHSIILRRKALTGRPVIIQQGRHQRTRQYVFYRIHGIRPAHIGLQPARVEAVDQHIAVFQFGRQVACILIDRGLRDTVGRQVRCIPDPG